MNTFKAFIIITMLSGVTIKTEAGPFKTQAACMAVSAVLVDRLIDKMPYSSVERTCRKPSDIKKGSI